MSDNEVLDGVPMRAPFSSSNHHILTPPLDFANPSHQHRSTSQSNGAKISPNHIPHRESVPSASDIPSQTSPGQPPSQLSSFSSVSHLPLKPWASYPGTDGPATTLSDADKSYLELYTLKQAQLEQAEKSHEEMMDEMMKARINAEQFAERIQKELREEVKATLKDEETMRKKLEEQLRKEREMWNTEREMLLQKLKHKEQEVESLGLQTDHLTKRLSIYEANGMRSNDSLSAHGEENVRFRSPPSRSFSPPGRLPSAQLRSFSPSGRSFSPSGRQIHSAERSLSPSKMSKPTAVDRVGYYGFTLTPNTLNAQEQPYSPPPSAAAPPMSPPPPSYLRHAGHTPRASVSLLSPGADGEISPGVETPKQSNYASLGAVARETARAGEPLKEKALGTLEEEDFDKDVPLKGALGLKNNPEDSTFILEVLDKKLEDVSNDPLHHPPQVFQRGDDELSVISESVDGKSSDGTEGASATQGAKDNGVGPQSKEGGEAEDIGDTKGEKDEDEPIPLRLKPSMNFGAPLGQVRRKGHEGSSEHDLGQ